MHDHFNVGVFVKVALWRWFSRALEAWSTNVKDFSTRRYVCPRVPTTTLPSMPKGGQCVHCYYNEGHSLLVAVRCVV